MTIIDQKALADRVASQTNDEVQAILRSRRKSGVPGGLGDSRAIRAAIHENVTQLLTTDSRSLSKGVIAR
jgi:hypothetical protein